MIGKTISHYKILEKLGAGGMGVVYKAEDTKLKRTVALKFLPPELTRDPDAKARFIREAQAASSLDHPNICIIHEVNEAEDGQMFIVMACYEGETLKDKIKDKRIKTEDAIDIAIQIAQGLDRAHEEGIVHRDIKPANIIITDRNEIKILDFGLAKLAGHVQLTKDTSTLGTVAYMSPEQLSGKEVDKRTDIWSLGVVLFEMLFAELPFRGEYEQAVIYSILNEEPKIEFSNNKEIPNNIGQIINKSLEKNPDLRYQNLIAVIEDLKGPLLQDGQTDKTKPSIIVLPFENISPDPDQEYFSDGLTEEVITDLSQIHDLLVISRSSAMTFKGSQKKITEIAKEVNVQYVLEGSVRKAGNHLRIAAQLIDAIRDVHIWAEKYNGNLDDIFEIQEKVSRSIVEALKLKLSPKEDERLAKRQFENVQSYECWLKARHEALQWTESNLKQAMQYMNKGLEIIGKNSVIFAGIGFIHIQYFNSGVKKDISVFEEAEKWFQKAFQLDQDVFLGHYGLGFSRYLQGNMKEAISHLKKALDINPNNADVIRLLCYIYSMQIGKPDLAVTLSQKVIEVDPLFPVNYLGPAFIHWAKGELNLALEACSKYYEMAPENIHARAWYEISLVWNSRYEEASTLIDSNIRDYPEHTITKFQVFFRHALKNEKNKVFEDISEDLKSYAWHHVWYAWLLAEGFALVYESSESLKWLTRLVDLGFINYPLLSKIDPFFENIRSDERFNKLMERVKHEWENFDV